MATKADELFDTRQSGWTLSKSAGVQRINLLSRPGGNGNLGDDGRVLPVINTETARDHMAQKIGDSRRPREHQYDLVLRAKATGT